MVPLVKVSMVPLGEPRLELLTLSLSKETNVSMEGFVYSNAFRYRYIESQKVIFNNIQWTNRSDKNKNSRSFKSNEYIHKKERWAIPWFWL